MCTVFPVSHPLPLVHVATLVLHAPVPVAFVLHQLAVVRLAGPIELAAVALAEAAHPLAVVLQLRRPNRGQS